MSDFKWFSAPSLTTRVMALRSILFSSSLSNDFQHILFWSSDRYTNLLCGTEWFSECFNMIYPRVILPKIYEIYSSSLQESLLRITGLSERRLSCLFPSFISAMAFPTTCSTLSVFCNVRNTSRLPSGHKHFDRSINSDVLFRSLFL